MKYNRKPQCNFDFKMNPISSIPVGVAQWQTASEDTPELAAAVVKVFEERIAPLYGNQERQVASLLAGSDRKVRVMFVPERSAEPAGVLAYKKNLVSEFEGCDDALEIKTLTLTEPQKFRGCGSLLLEKAVSAAKKRGAACLELTVAGDATPERRAVHDWFARQGFEDVCILPEGTYRAGATEIVMRRPL
jgi:hypothetical protein